MNYGYIPSQKSSKDLSADILFGASIQSIPDEYQIKKYSGRVLNQEAMPMCSACAALNNVEWRFYMNDVNHPIDLSEEYLYSQRSNFPSAGMIPRNTFEILKNNGVCTYQSYKDKDNSKIAEECKIYRIKGFARIEDYETIKKCLITNGPVYIALPVKNDSSPEFWNGNKSLGGHAISIVGYDKEGFIIKNSWGMNFGSSGYCKLKYKDQKNILEAWTLY